MNLKVTLRKPHKIQSEFVNCQAKRIVVRAGRRSGKTVGVAQRAVVRFLEGKRQLYAAPTSDQLQRFWAEVVFALAEPIEKGIFKKNESLHTIEVPGTAQRIRAKTAWNADSLRGDYCDDLILDEFQLMNEDIWELVGAPMLLDNNGDAIFIYTPPALHSRSTTKADDPQHAAKFYKKAALDKSGRWKVFHFTSHDNPYISAEALGDITKDMTSLAYRMEIMAEDVDEAPGALWTRAELDRNRVTKHPDLDRLIVAIDPSGTSTGDEAGIVTAGKCGDVGYVLEDNSVQASPLGWATAAITAYYKYKADAIVAEDNNGGEMVEFTINTVDPNVKVIRVHASRGKATRAEPIAAQYEKNRWHHVGAFPLLEDELCLWRPGDKSPNRLDALVWAATELMLGEEVKFKLAVL